MNLKQSILALFFCFINGVEAQQKVKDFYYLEPETKNLPVLLRGNLEAKKILLYVQGGGAENGIDFARSDYPKWKNTLEKEIAIAYFDQRGLNRKVKKIDSTKINSSQISLDIIAIAKSLRKKYNAEVYLFGHSMGGVDILRCLARFPEESSFIVAGITFNTPITSDFSPERYNHYRPLYLRNLAKELIAQGKDSTYWQGAYNWMTETDSLSSHEDSKKWNEYVDNAYPLIKRRISLKMIMSTLFSKPYDPISYFNNNDNKFVADKLWHDQRQLWNTGKQTTMWELLPKIKKPVFLITGRFDAIATPEEQEEAHRLIQDSDLLIIPECTHESYIVQPEVFNNSILNYLRQEQEIK